MKSILEYDKETLEQHFRDLLLELSPAKNLFGCYMLGGLSFVVKEIIVLAWRLGVPNTDERLRITNQYLALVDAHIRVDELFWERDCAKSTYSGKDKYLKNKAKAAEVLGVPMVDDCPGYSFRSRS